MDDKPMAGKDHFDESRALLRKPDMFKRFRIKGPGQELASAGLDPAADLIVFERGGLRAALTTRRMGYHHLAQGEIKGQPLAVSF